MTEKISRSIFKAYDIRGIVDKTLTEEACEQIGQALGTLAHEKKVEKICVGRDRLLLNKLLDITSERFQHRYSTSARFT